MSFLRFLLFVLCLLFFGFVTWQSSWTEGPPIQLSVATGLDLRGRPGSIRRSDEP